MNKSTMVVSVIGRAVSAGLLFWALARHPYDYYTLLRWIVCATCGLMVYIAVELEKPGWAWAVGIIGVLFNPIIPVHLSRATWQPIDVIAGVILLVSIPFTRKVKGE